MLPYFAHLVCVCIYCIMDYYGEGMARTSTVKTETNKQIDTMNANNSQRNQTGTLGCNPLQWEGGKLQNYHRCLDSRR